MNTNGNQAQAYEPPPARRPRAGQAPGRAQAILAAAATVILLAGGCGDSPPPTEPSAGDGMVHGTVAKAKTGEGVANMVVALMQGGAVVRVAATDSSGDFSFDGVAAGEYTARLTGLELSGLSPRHTALEPPEQTITVSAEEPVELFFATVGIIPSQIVGYVRCGGEAAVGAQVRVVGGATDTTVTVNVQGKYGATELEAGHYAVFVREAPCTMDPAYRVAEVMVGQATTVNFEG